MVSNRPATTTVFFGGLAMQFGPPPAQPVKVDLKHSGVANDNGGAAVVTHLAPARVAVLSNIKRRASEIVNGLMQPQGATA